MDIGHGRRHVRGQPIEALWTWLFAFSRESEELDYGFLRELSGRLHARVYSSRA